MLKTLIITLVIQASAFGSQYCDWAKLQPIPNQSIQQNQAKCSECVQWEEIESNTALYTMPQAKELHKDLMLWAKEHGAARYECWPESMGPLKPKRREIQ